MLMNFRLILEVLPDLLSSVTDYYIMVWYSILVEGCLFKIEYPVKFQRRDTFQFFGVLVLYFDHFEIDNRRSLCALIDERSNLIDSPEGQPPV